MGGFLKIAHCVISTTTKDVLPYFIEGLDGSWYMTSIGNYIHVGERLCSIDLSVYDDGVGDCWEYCWGLGEGSDFAIPQTVEEYESYYQTILDNTTSLLEVGYGLLDENRAWENMKFCSNQPLVGQYNHLGSIIGDTTNPVWDQTKCAHKFDTYRSYRPVCVYNP